MWEVEWPKMGFRAGCYGVLTVSSQGLPGVTPASSATNGAASTSQDAEPTKPSAPPATSAKTASPRNGAVMTEREIAAELGISRGRVSQLLQSALRKLGR